MLSNEKITAIRDTCHAMLRQHSHSAKGLSVRLLDGDQDSTDNQIAWAMGLHGLSLQLNRSNDSSLAAVGQAVADASDLRLDYGDAFRLGICILAPERGEVDVPSPVNARCVPAGIAAGDSVEFTALTRAEVEASVIFRVACGWGPDAKAAAALFVWITGLTTLRAITKQNLSIVRSVLPRLPASFGKGGPRHWEMTVERAIATINPAGPRLSKDRCARHIRHLSKLRSAQVASNDLGFFLDRMDNDTKTVKLANEEYKLFCSSRYFRKYVVFVVNGRVCSAWYLPAKRDEVSNAIFDLTGVDTASLAAHFRNYLHQQLVGSSKPTIRYGTSVHQFVRAAAHWLFNSGSCVICSKDGDLLSDLVCLDDVLRDTQFVALKRWAANLRLGSTPEQRTEVLKP